MQAAWAYRHSIPRFREKLTSTAPTDAEIEGIVTTAVIIVNLFLSRVLLFGIAACPFAVHAFP
jgi:hypothetical protein